MDGRFASTCGFSVLQQEPVIGMTQQPFKIIHAVALLKRREPWVTKVGNGEPSVKDPCRSDDPVPGKGPKDARASSIVA